MIEKYLQYLKDANSESSFVKEVDELYGLFEQKPIPDKKELRKAFHEKILIDLKIILDMLNRRQDHESAVRIIKKCLSRDVKGYICSHEITALSYFLEKKRYRKDKIRYTIIKLLDIFSVLPPTGKKLRNALFSEIIDYEDAVIEASALNEDIDFIVSRDLEDFRKSKVKAIDSKEALLLLM